ncbi:MAG: lipocalin-like domain-containing protein [Steroidobacteraceae bacterium]
MACIARARAAAGGLCAERAPGAQLPHDAEPAAAGRLGGCSPTRAAKVLRACSAARAEFLRDHGPHPAFATNGISPGISRARRRALRFRADLLPLCARTGRIARCRRGGAPALGARTDLPAHFALTDPGRREFRFLTERHARGAPGPAGAQAQPLRVWGRGLVARGAGLTARGGCRRAQRRGRARARSPRRAASSAERRARLQPQVRRAAGAASYGHSMPRLEARGQLLRRRITARGTVERERFELDGLVWLDREWGSGALGAAQVGWDCPALQLEDGSSLMFYALRHRDGGRDAYSAAPG